MTEKKVITLAEFNALSINKRRKHYGWGAIDINGSGTPEEVMAKACGFQSEDFYQNPDWYGGANLWTSGDVEMGVFYVRFKKSVNFGDDRLSRVNRVYVLSVPSEPISTYEIIGEHLMSFPNIEAYLACIWNPGRESWIVSQARFQTAEGDEKFGNLGDGFRNAMNPHEGDPLDFDVMCARMKTYVDAVREGRPLPGFEAEQPGAPTPG